MSHINTPIDLCNAALNQLGAGVIQSFQEQNKLAITASLHYNRARLSMLRDNPWSFALKRTTLATISNPGLPPQAAIDYPYVYALPSDLILLWRVENDGNYRKEGERLYSHFDTCEIVYTADVEDPALFDPKFEDALVARLCYEMAYAVTRDMNVRNQNYSFYQDKMQDAKYSNAIEDIEDQLDFDNQAFLQVRYR